MARSLLRRPRLQVHTLAVVALAVLAGQATGSQTQVMLKEDAQADLDALFRESVARGDVPSVVAVVRIDKRFCTAALLERWMKLGLWTFTQTLSSTLRP